MKEYKLKKIAMLFGVLCVFFGIRGMFWIRGISEDLEQNIYPRDDLFLSTISDGFFGIMEQVLVGTILIVIAIEYILEKDESYFLIRHPSKISYLNVRFQTVMGVGAAVSLSKFLMGTLSLASVFGIEQVFNRDFSRFLLTGIFIFATYSIRCGIIYMITKDLLNKKVMAMGITVIIYFTLFYIWLDNLLRMVITVRWMPFLDLSAAILFSTGQMSGFEFLITMVRQTGLLLIFLLIWIKVWNRKDVICLEK